MYNIDGNDIIVLAEGRLVNLGVRHRSPKFCDE
jgi:S-adenosylhomocysteine hydrolase